MQMHMHIHTHTYTHTHTHINIHHTYRTSSRSRAMRCFSAVLISGDKRVLVGDFLSGDAAHPTAGVDVGALERSAQCGVCYQDIKHKVMRLCVCDEYMNKCTHSHNMMSVI